MEVITPEEFHESVEAALKSDREVFSIKIIKEDNKTYDIRIWNERENESAEEIEEGHFRCYGDAFMRLADIIYENNKAIFIRAQDELE